MRVLGRAASAAATTFMWMLRSAYWSSYTNTRFYPPYTFYSETSTLNNASHALLQIMPYDGKVVRISSWHQRTNSRNTTLEMYINGDDDDPVGDQRGTDLVVTGNTQSFTADCPADWTFSKGECISIGRTDTVSTYGTTMTFVIELDLTT